MTVKLNRWIYAGRAALLGLLLLLATSLTAQDTPPTEPPTTVTETNQVAPAAEGETTEPAVTNAPENRELHREWRRSQEPMVVIGNFAELHEGDTKDAMVVVLGDSVVKGEVRDAAITVLGDMTVSGKIGDAIVAVLGNLRISGESGDIISVLGDVTLEDNAIVHGDILAIGGIIDKSPSAQVKGEIMNPAQLGFLRIDALRDWFLECVVLMRPLSLDVGWVWGVAGVFLLFYLLVAVALPKPVQSCVGELTRRPITSFFLGVVTLPLALIICLILAVTGIGLIIVVFLLPALLFAGCVGKVGLLQYLGDAIRRATGSETRFNPLAAVLAGAALLTLLYLIPFLGLITFAVTGLWGLGAAISATFGGMKRELPDKPAPPAAMPPGGATPVMPVAAAPSTPEPSAFATTPPMNAPTDPWPAAPTTATPTAATAPLTPPTVPEALAFPRASFWQRMAAIFLDAVVVGFLIALLVQLLPRGLDRPPFIFLIPLAYFVGMWAWRNTTIGGIVLGLKVVRQDNGKVTWAVALVRALSSLLSFFVLFLGFIWIAWDPEKQAWHDRIAGTVVVRLPRGTPLVLL